MIDDGARAVALDQVVDVDGQGRGGASLRHSAKGSTSTGRPGGSGALRRVGPRLDQEDELGPGALRSRSPAA